VQSQKNRLGGAELHSPAQTEFLLHSLRTDEASVDRLHSRLRGISCCLTRGTTYHKTRSYRRTLPPYLVNIIKQRRRILCLYRSSLYSLNKYIHHELRATKRAQCQESCLGLEPKNTQRFWNHSKKLFKERATSIRGFLDEQDNRVITETDRMIEHGRQYYSETFREKETASRNQEMAEFKNHLTEKPVELHSPNIQ
jgi:hypothetical protein